MLQIHSSSTARVCFNDMEPWNKIQHCQIGVCTEACCPVLLHWLPPNQQCHFMLQELGWENFQSRRDQNKATVMHRIVNNLVEIPAGQYLIVMGVAIRGHHQRHLSTYCSIKVYKGSFFPSTVHLWSGLPLRVISVPTFKDFKLRVGAGILRPRLWTTRLTEFNCTQEVS